MILSFLYNGFVGMCLDATIQARLQLHRLHHVDIESRVRTRAAVHSGKRVVKRLCGHGQICAEQRVLGDERLRHGLHHANFLAPHDGIIDGVNPASHRLCRKISSQSSLEHCNHHQCKQTEANAVEPKSVTTRWGKAGGEEREQCECLSASKRQRRAKQQRART